MKFIKVIIFLLVINSSVYSNEDVKLTKKQININLRTFYILSIVNPLTNLIGVSYWFPYVPTDLYDQNENISKFLAYFTPPGFILEMVATIAPSIILKMIFNKELDYNINAIYSLFFTMSVFGIIPIILSYIVGVVYGVLAVKLFNQNNNLSKNKAYNNIKVSLENYENKFNIYISLKIKHGT